MTEPTKKVALITGGNCGIGKAIALKLAGNGIEVILDVSVLLRDTFGKDRIDDLINNAGAGKAIPIDDLTEEDFDAFVDVHFKGVVFLTQKALRRMNDGGVVVFITAAADRYNVPNYAAYAACKGAVESSRGDGRLQSLNGVAPKSWRGVEYARRPRKYARRTSCRARRRV